MTLEKGANVGELIDEIVTCMRNNKKIIQLGSFFSRHLPKHQSTNSLYSMNPLPLVSMAPNIVSTSFSV